MKYIVVDIDGTMTMPGSDRLKYIQGPVKDWETYYSKCGEDKPNEKVVNLIKTLLFSNSVIKPQYNIVYCTGRREKERQLTLDWLEHYTGQASDNIKLFMRDNGDYRKDHIIKPQILRHEGIYPANTDFILDDRLSVVNALREEGFTVFQVAEGNF